MNIFLILIPYMRKHLINNLDYHEYLLINNIFIILYVFIITYYYYYYKKEKYENLKNLEINKYIIIGGLAFLTIFSSYMLSTLKLDNTTSIIKLISNIVIIGLLSLIFNKILTECQIIGAIFCIIGIYLMNKK